MKAGRLTPTDIYLALLAANNPSNANPFATMADIIAGAFAIPAVANYSALPAAGTVDQKYYRTIAGEGPGKWKQFFAGGTYYPEGIYQSVGGVWDYVGEFPFQADQATVDGDTNNTEFVTALTLANYYKWATKANTVHAHISTDITDFTEASQDAVGGSLLDTVDIDFTYDDALNTISAVLTVTGVAANTYGSATQVPQITVDAKGRITGVTNVTISLSSADITDFNEAAQDAIGSILADSADIDFSYNDAGAIISAVLTNSGVSANTYGSASQVPQFTVDSKGRIIGVTDINIDIVSTQISDFTEAVQDVIGGMVTGNTEDGLSVTYDDTTGKLNFTNTDKGSVAVTAHEAAVDPHPQYTTSAEASAAAPVQSVFSRTGTVVSANGDYTASQITNVPSGNISSTNVQAALNELDSEKQATLTDISFGAFVTTFDAKITPVDADTFNLVDSADSNKAKEVTWANVKATLLTYFNGIYQVILVSGTNIKTYMGKTLLGSGDIYNNVKLIQSASDFPAAVAGVITWADNVTYKLNGSINIGTDRIALGASNKLFGLDKSNDKLIYTGTGAMFTGSNKDLSITFCTLANVTAGSTLFALTGTTNNTQITDCIFGSCKSLGSISGGNTITLDRNLITGCSGGINLSGGTTGECILADNEWLDNLSTITNITITSGTFNFLKVSRNPMEIDTGQIGLALSDAVVITGNAVVELCDFSGTGTYITGVNFTSPVWILRSNRGPGIVNTFLSLPRATERALFAARATNGTFSTMGMSMTLDASSNAQNSDNTTTYTSVTSPALLGGAAFLQSTIFTEIRPDYSPIMSFVIKTGTSLTTARYWTGLLSATPTNADDQTGAYAAFRCSSVAGDTVWRCIVDTGGANTNTASSVTVATSTQYKFEIQMDFANGKTYFRINGGAWVVVPAIPPSGTTMGFACGVFSTAALTARTINISRLDGNHN